MSMPRAAMSVATRTRNLPALKPWSAAVRWPCERLPWIGMQEMPSAVRLAARRLARCLVRVKTMTESRVVFSRSFLSRLRF